MGGAVYYYREKRLQASHRINDDASQSYLQRGRGRVPSIFNSSASSTKDTSKH